VVRVKLAFPIEAVRLEKIEFDKLVKLIGLLSGNLGKYNTSVPAPSVTANSMPSQWRQSPTALLIVGLSPSGLVLRRVLSHR